MPFVKPVTVHDVEAVVHVRLPGDDVTAYPVIGEPPLLPGEIQLTVACPFPAWAVTLLGEPGLVAGVTALEGLDAGDEGEELMADTVNV